MRRHLSRELPDYVNLPDYSGHSCQPRDALDSQSPFAIIAKAMERLFWFIGTAQIIENN
jgi:hypothetical protein